VEILRKSAAQQKLISVNSVVCEVNILPLWRKFSITLYMPSYQCQVETLSARYPIEMKGSQQSFRFLLGISAAANKWSRVKITLPILFPFFPSQLNNLITPP